jgi:hypothetical protein
VLVGFVLEGFLMLLTLIEKVCPELILFPVPENVMEAFTVKLETAQDTDETKVPAAHDKLEGRVTSEGKVNNNLLGLVRGQLVVTDIV